MFSIADAQSLLMSRFDGSQLGTDGRVELPGQWSLHELEALCALIRDQFGDRAEGTEEYLVRKGAIKSVMPYPKLEAIVRRYAQAVITKVALNMKDDVGQLNNPGSVPVYGVPDTDSRGKGLLFTHEQIFELTVGELSVEISEMNTELSALGCSTSTQIVAAGMLWSSVLDTEQEEAIKAIERRNEKQQKA